VVDEYVQLAHAFLGKVEAGFVNAVLDRLARELRPDTVTSESSLTEIFPPFSSAKLAPSIQPFKSSEALRTKRPATLRGSRETTTPMLAYSPI
jgi:hypothetical protein